jgi:hypothetical protein
MSEKFDFEFVYNHEKMNATCEKRKGGRYLQFNVQVKKSDESEETYDFFEVNRPGQKIAWFNYRQERNQMSAIIAKALIESTRPKQERPSRLRPVLVKTVIFLRSVAQIPSQIKNYWQRLKQDCQEILAEANKAGKEMV